MVHDSRMLGSCRLHEMFSQRLWIKLQQLSSPFLSGADQKMVDQLRVLVLGGGRRSLKGLLCRRLPDLDRRGFVGHDRDGMAAGMKGYSRVDPSPALRVHPR